MSTAKTRWTLEEATEDAFEQFPFRLNRYEVGRMASRDNGDSYLGEILVDFLNGRPEAISRDGSKVVKLTRSFVRKEFEAQMKKEWTEGTIARWCSANQIQRYQVDSAIWFERWVTRAQEAPKTI